MFVWKKKKKKQKNKKNRMEKPFLLPPLTQFLGWQRVVLRRTKNSYTAITLFFPEKSKNKREIHLKCKVKTHTSFRFDVCHKSENPPPASQEYFNFETTNNQFYFISMISNNPELFFFIPSSATFVRILTNDQSIFCHFSLLILAIFSMK